MRTKAIILSLLFSSSVEARFKTQKRAVTPVERAMMREQNDFAGRL
jgi:hypothetical protein